MSKFLALALFLASSAFACDLGVSRCELDGVVAELSPKPLKAMSKMSVSLSGAKLKLPHIVVRGVGMDMGQKKVGLIPRGKQWQGSFAVPSCVSQMSWELVLFDGDSELGSLGTFTPSE